MATFPAAPLKFRTAGFPQYGFKFQAPLQFSRESSHVGRWLKCDLHIRHRPTQLALAFGIASAGRDPTSMCGASASDDSTWTQRSRSGEFFMASPSSLADLSASLVSSGHFPAEPVIGTVFDIQGSLSGFQTFSRSPVLCILDQGCSIARHETQGTEVMPELSAFAGEVGRPRGEVGRPRGEVEGARGHCRSSPSATCCGEEGFLDLVQATVF